MLTAQFSRRRATSLLGAREARKPIRSARGRPVRHVSQHTPCTHKGAGEGLRPFDPEGRPRSAAACVLAQRASRVRSRPMEPGQAAPQRPPQRHRRSSRPRSADTARGVGRGAGEGAWPREGRSGPPVPVPRANSTERRGPRERLVDLSAARLPGDCDAEPEQRVWIIHRLQIHIHPA